MRARRRLVGSAVVEVFADGQVVGAPAGRPLGRGPRSRLTGGDDAPRVDHELTLHDLGAHADGALLDLLDDASVFGVVVPRDPALAAGGRVPLNRLTRESRRAQGELVSYLRERLASHRDAR
ncbi:hypothetical protein [Frigoribacterium sp. R86507]|uniref:hypothetical protein n=1 Tax=Frigoribacterium sp. R86507 TaxID=3093850 RepID=UPI0037C51B3F